MCEAYMPMVSMFFTAPLLHSSKPLCGKRGMDDGNNTSDENPLSSGFGGCEPLYMHRPCLGFSIILGTALPGVVLAVQEQLSNEQRAVQVQLSNEQHIQASLESIFCGPLGDGPFVARDASGFGGHSSAIQEQVYVAL